MKTNFATALLLEPVVVTRLLRYFLAQPVQLLTYKLAGIDQLARPVHHPPLRPVCPRCASGPLLEVPIFVHRPTPDHEYQRFREALSPLSEAGAGARTLHKARSGQP